MIAGHLSSDQGSSDHGTLPSGWLPSINANSECKLTPTSPSSTGPRGGSRLSRPESKAFRRSRRAGDPAHATRRAQLCRAHDGHAVRSRHFRAMARLTVPSLTRPGSIWVDRGSEQLRQARQIGRSGAHLASRPASGYEDFPSGTVGRHGISRRAEVLSDFRFRSPAAGSGYSSPGFCSASPDRSKERFVEVPILGVLDQQP